MKKTGFCIALLIFLLSGAFVAGWSRADQNIKKSPGNASNYIGHGIAMHGDLKYDPNFKHFDYVNPNAPKGGEVRLATVGYFFDSLNGFIRKGAPASGLGLTYDTLLARSDDEAFSMYGLVAESIEFPEDRSWTEFTIRKEARFHDGSKILPEDVVFSMEILKDKGHPFFGSYYHDVKSAEKVGDRKVRFTFYQAGNREMPLIVGEIPILSKKYWQSRDFTVTTLESPLSSGPYKIKDFTDGKTITYERVKNWWAKDLPINKGRFNFDIIKFIHYLDDTPALEGFKKGVYDFRFENTAKIWATGYNGPALTKGWIKKEEIKNENNQGMQALVFNTRRDIFSDQRVRRALIYMFDFESINKTMMYGAYKRTSSYFANSELASRGVPEGKELEILKQFRGRIPDSIFTKEYKLPTTNGNGNNRNNRRIAKKLFREAGWTVNSNTKILTHVSGKEMKFEVTVQSKGMAGIAEAFKEQLANDGIFIEVKLLDNAQYQKRVDNFDFDMIVANWGQSLSPGNEQKDMWHSSRVNIVGSRNFAGIKDPVVDKLIDILINAPDRNFLVAATRALDRVLLSGDYVIPQWHIDVWRAAYWDKFSRPRVQAKYNLGFLDSWWIDSQKEKKLKN